MARKTTAKKGAGAAKKNDKTKAMLAKKRAKDKEAKAKAKNLVEETKKLAPLAKEINVRLEKATGMEDKAYDHRLAAALQLQKAKEQCAVAKVPFKTWCEENVDQSYESVRKLAAVGAADDPKKALEDLRGKNKEANKKLRDDKKAKAKKKASKGKSDDTPEEVDENHTPHEAIGLAIEAMDEEDAIAALKDYADGFEMSVVSRDNTVTEEMEDLFGDLEKDEQIDFLRWAAEELGGELVFTEEEEKPKSKRQRRTRKAA